MEDMIQTVRGQIEITVKRRRDGVAGNFINTAAV